MAPTLWTLSGSPYAWRVWLALEHKGLPYELKFLSYDAGDFKKPDFAAVNPRRRVPVLVEADGFALYESAAIVDYLEDTHPQPRLFPADPRQRAVVRRMVREADQYVATELEHLVDAVIFTPPDKRDPATVGAAWEALRQEVARWETPIQGDFLAGAALTAADITLFPELALARRIASRTPEMITTPLAGPRIAAWMARMDALDVVQKTWPPHWKG